METSRKPNRNREIPCVSSEPIWDRNETKKISIVDSHASFGLTYMGCKLSSGLHEFVESLRIAFSL